MADASWPYSASGPKSPSLGMGQVGGSLGQYPSHMSSSQSSIAPSSWPGSMQLSRAQTSNGSTNLAWAAAPARSVYRANFGVNYSDDYIEPYNMQSPQYLLPSQDSQVSGLNYGTQDVSRNWTPMAMTNRIPQTGSFLDQDVHSRYGAPTYPYMNSPASAGTADASSLSFPAMTSLATSLPVPSSNADRILPTPTPKNVPVSSTNNGLQMLSDTNSYASQPNSYKASMPWGPESVTTGGSQSSTATSVSVDPSSVIGASRHKSSSPPPSSQETSFGYIPISHSPPGITAITASDYSSSSVPTATRGIEGYGSSAHSVLRDLSGDPLMPSHNSSSNIYSYTVGSSTRRGSNADTATSDGTLVSGQPYTRLRQPQPHHTTSFDTLRRDSGERSSRITHRTSISSIDNSRHY